MVRVVVAVVRVHWTRDQRVRVQCQVAVADVVVEEGKEG